MISISIPRIIGFCIFEQRPCSDNADMTGFEKGAVFHLKKFLLLFCRKQCVKGVVCSHRNNLICFFQILIERMFQTSYI